MNLSNRSTLDLCDDCIGEDDELCRIRRGMPEPAHTDFYVMETLLPMKADFLSPFMGIPECNPGMFGTPRVRFNRKRMRMGEVTFDAWICDKDGKAYL